MAAKRRKRTVPSSKSVQSPMSSKRQTDPKEQPAPPEGAEGGAPKLKPLLLRIPETLHTQLRHLSIDKRESINAMLTEVISTWYAQQVSGNERG